MLKGYSNFKFIKGDISNKSFIDKLFGDYHFDIVVNLAAQPGVRYSIDHPDAYIQSNIIGFYNILEACIHHPVKHLVYASSYSAYGGNTKVPMRKGDVPVAYADTSDLEKDFGYKPSTSLREGLRYFLE